MAMEILNKLQCYVMIVLFVTGKIQGKPNPTGIQVAAITDRIDGSPESEKEDQATVTADDFSTDSTTQGTGATHDRSLFTDTPIMDVVTIIWYLATFIALISFFLVMACADRNRCRSRKPTDAEATPPPTPAPSYRQFAPPSYDTLGFEKDTDSIFIIPYDNRTEADHHQQQQQHVEELATNLEQIIAPPPTPLPISAEPAASDIRDDSGVPVATEVASTVPVAHDADGTV